MHVTPLPKYLKVIYSFDIELEKSIYFESHVTKGIIKNNDIVSYV